MQSPQVTHQPLNREEREELLRLAQASLVHAVARGPKPAFRLASPSLLQPAAAFVSLHVAGALRGCVGAIEATQPLRQNVVDMAREAACHDPRFPAVRPAEIRSLAIEVSRLGPQRLAGSQGIVPGRHGVRILLGAARALLLPQVAPRFGWSGIELLEQTCIKAGLSGDAWRDPRAEVYIFEAEVFDDTT